MSFSSYSNFCYPKFPSLFHVVTCTTKEGSVTSSVHDRSLLNCRTRPGHWVLSWNLAWSVSGLIFWEIPLYYSELWTILVSRLLDFLQNGMEIGFLKFNLSLNINNKIDNQCLKKVIINQIPNNMGNWGFFWLYNTRQYCLEKFSFFYD